MRRLHPLILLVAVVFAMVIWHRRAPSPAAVDHPAATAQTGSQGSNHESLSDGSALPSFLPPEARTTLDAIARGGPFEHRQDGVVFGNYEGLLPQQPRGYYHEYTVETPGADTRGTRRIITGGTPPTVYYYTDDHYRSFRRFEASR
ncbi:MAG TPA: ribonuclease domain-containing protein [Rhodanobacter sp.]